MSADNEMRRPGQEAAQIEKQDQHQGSAERPCRGVRHEHAVVVVTGLANGRSRARVVLTLAAAQRIVDNARRRGLPAQICLVRLSPVSATADQLAELLAGADR